MNKIEEYSNWCHIDRLDGTDLTEGKLIVEWPDGHLEQVDVKIERTSYEISDMGHPYDVPVQKAYIEASHRGITTKVYLKGLRAQRV